MRWPGISGPDACERLRRRLPDLGVVMQTNAPTEGAVLSAFSAGARSLVLKESSEPNILFQAIRWVHRGHTYIDPRVGGRVVAMLLRHDAIGSDVPQGQSWTDRRLEAGSRG